MPRNHVTEFPPSLLTAEEEAKVLETILAEEAKLYKDTLYTTSMFIGIYTNKVLDCRGNACHSKFAGMYGNTFLGVFNYWPHHEENLFPEVSAALTRFIKYIYEEAPCSYFIPFKDNEEVRAKGFFMPALLPKAFIHFFNIIGRTIHESSEQLVRWHELVEAGVNPDIAMFLIKRLSKLSTGDVYEMGYAHSSPFTTSDKDTCKNYHDHMVTNFQHLTLPCNNGKECSLYRGTGNIFKSEVNCPPALITSINKDLKELEKEVEKVNEIRLDNPFTKVRSTGGLPSVDGGWEAVTAIGLKWTEDFKGGQKDE